MKVELKVLVQKIEKRFCQVVRKFKEEGETAKSGTGDKSGTHLVLKGQCAIAPASCCPPGNSQITSSVRTQLSSDFKNLLADSQTVP